MPFSITGDKKNTYTLVNLLYDMGKGERQQTIKDSLATELCFLNYFVKLSYQDLEMFII